MNRIVGVNSNTYHGYRLEDALDGIAAAGFRYVELTATKGWTEHVFPDQPFAYLSGIKRRMEALSLKPFAMSGHCNLMDKARLADFVLNMELAAFFGCDYIVSSIGEAHLEDRETAGQQGVIRNIAALVPELEKLNLKLVLETHGADHSTGKILKDIVDGIGSERVAINYDTANVIFYGGVSPEIDMLDCIDRIAFLHIKDKAGAEKEWNFPALGKGQVNFPAILGNLEKAGNDSPFSVELEFTPDGAGSLEAVNQAVLESARYLKSLGLSLDAL